MRRNLASTILLVPFLCLPPCVGLYAQVTRPAVDSLIRQADSLLTLRKLSEAQALYTSALKVNSTSLAALLGMGRAAMAGRSWLTAIDLFEQASELDTSNLDARYYLGCAYGERGRARYMIEKLLGLITKSSYDKACLHLDWVLARDSLFRDALYQLALVSYFEHDYWKAIPLAIRQIELKPNLRNGHVGVQKIYREAIAMQQGSTVPERLLRPESDYDQFYYAEWLRRKGRLEEAERDLQALREKPGIVRPQLILQSLARIKAKQKANEPVEQLVAESIDLVQTMSDADLVLEDIKYLISDQELSQYEGLRSASEARQFFTTFWTKRNPYPALQTNARIAQHYERLVYAEEYYEQFGRKTFAVETMPLDFPQAYFLNEEFNDKGIIYLRHGEPNHKIITMSSSNGPAESNESWQYLATPEYPEMLFDFYVPMGAHVTEWRLVPVLPDPAMWEERAEYSHKYSRLVFSASGNLLESTEEGRREVSTGVTTDRFSFTSEVKYFESPISVACFRGSRGKTMVDIGYIVAPAEIGKVFPDTVQFFDVEAQYSMYTTSWKRVASLHKAQTYKRAKGSGSVMIELFRTSVVPDSYFVAWQAKPLHANMVFNRNLRMNVPDFSGSSLNMSDIELAYAIGPAKPGDAFNKGSISVAPNPVGKCPLDHPLYLYFEAYNLSRDDKGRTSYTIEYRLTSIEITKSFLARIFGGSRKTSVTVPSNRTGNDDWSPEHIALDVSELEAGKYDLWVTLKDRVAGTSVSRSVSVDLYEKE